MEELLLEIDNHLQSLELKIEIMKGEIEEIILECKRLLDCDDNV